MAHRISIVGRKKYADAVELLTEIGGTFHGVRSSSEKENVLIVSNQQFEKLVKHNIIEPKNGDVATRGKASQE